MVKVAVAIFIVLLIGVLSVDAQREGRRRPGRRKTTTEPPPSAEEIEIEENSAKPHDEPDSSVKFSSEQPVESVTSEPLNEKASTNSSHGGPPFILPRGTRKPRPHMRSSGVSRPKPTLPTFSRKRGPKPEHREIKKNDENSLASTSTTTLKPPRNSRNRNNAQERNANADKSNRADDGLEASTEAAQKKRFGGGTRRPSRGSRRYSPSADSEA